MPWSNGGTCRLAHYRFIHWSRPLLKKWRPDFAFDAQDRPARLLDLSLFDQFALMRGLRSCLTKEEYCRHFFEFISTHLQPYQYLLEKSTDAARYVPFIHSVFPNAKLLVIYRDGCDVVVSSRFFTENHLKRDSWSLQKSIMTWRGEIEAQPQYAESHRLFTCSYERLLSGGKQVAQRLFQHLELRTPDHLLDDILRRTSFKALTGRTPGEETRERFIRKGVSGD